MLTYGQARRILSEWHGGQSSAVYSVMSSGKMDRRAEAIEELLRDQAAVSRHPEAYNPEDVRGLNAVIVWLQLRKVTGDVVREEWVNAWDETPVSVTEQ